MSELHEAGPSDWVNWMSEKGMDADAAVHKRIYPQGCPDQNCWICHTGQRPTGFDTQVTSMAADPHWLDNWMERNGPYLYHYIGSGAMENLPNMNSFEKGLLPWDHRENPSFTTHDPAEPSLGPRPGHVYLRAKPLTFNDGVPRGEEWRNVKVDLRKLNPENLVADEDNVFMDNRDAARQWEEDQQAFQEENPHWAEDPWDIRDYSGGEFAEANPHFFDGPAETAKSLEGSHPTIAHRGPIPPEAMEFNPPGGVQLAARVAGIDEELKRAAARRPRP